MSGVQTGADAKAKLLNLADRISQLQAEKSRIEGQVESLENQRAAVEARCRDYSVDPVELDKMIQVRRDTLYGVIQSMEKAVSDIELRRDRVQRV
jgi:chromosome segregation ATPase